MILRVYEVTAYPAHRSYGNVHKVAGLTAEFVYGSGYFLGSAIALVVGVSHGTVVVGLQACDI